MDETTFTRSHFTDKPSTLRLKQKVDQDKLAAFYRRLNVTADPDLVDKDSFGLIKNFKDRKHLLL